MNADERIRTGLRRNASSFTPDVDLALRRVLGRPRTVVPRRPLMGMAAALIAVLALGAVVRRGDQGPPTPSATVPPPPTATIVELRFETVLPPGDRDAAADLAGRWRIGLEPGGTVALTPPEPFRGEVVTPAATFSGHELTTDVFGEDVCAGHSPGRYHWSIAPWGDLNLAVVDDGCPARVELLAGPGHSWAPSGVTPTPSDGS